MSAHRCVAGSMVICGVVVGRGGKPIAGALVALESGEHEDIAAISGNDGSFRLQAPAPGMYKVTAWSNGRTGSAVADVHKGESTFITIEIS